MDQALAVEQTRIGRFRRKPAAAAALAVFVLGAATIAGAWYFQLALKLPPCALCLEERIPYYIVVPLSLLLSIAASMGAPRQALALGFFAILFSTLAGAGLGIYHAGVEWHFWPGPADCTGTLTNLKAHGPLLSQLRTYNVVRCDEAAWRFLGISLAGYNALISLLMAAIAAFGLSALKHPG
ncbi:MAG: disulfide bond formation protein B [Pseudomonadota bacterium]